MRLAGGMRTVMAAAVALLLLAVDLVPRSRVLVSASTADQTSTAAFLARSAAPSEDSAYHATRHSIHG